MSQDKQEASAAHPDRKRIKGVFSTQEVRKVGTGTTTRKTIQKAFWMVEELDNGVVEVQPLNSNYIPSGPKRKVNVDDVINTFQPEPEFYVQTVFPKMQELTKTVARADRHRTRGEHFSAEYEYGNALQVDEENVRANFGLGLTYLERGESAKADNIFERLVKLEAAFEPEHKHLFNEFGISLRKNKMFDQAMEYYERAVELSGSDENLQYNMARACLEKKDYAKTMEHLLKCLEANPTLEAAVKFLVWMKAKDLIPQEMRGAAVDMLKVVKAAQDGTAPASGAEKPAAADPKAGIQKAAENSAAGGAAPKPEESAEDEGTATPIEL
ncbi:tetratricopeptide repeat protein [Oleidesulfovibrio sp.]|uniref:tetratricopeptide repeat protein n=1 Tax=Oleidesulfovibrio sp. TaxID=2909707 RepID=UPI003A8C112E